MIQYILCQLYLSHFHDVQALLDSEDIKNKKNDNIGNTMSNVEFVEYEFVETLKIPVLSLSCIHCHYRAIDSTIKYK